jgi:hypothetical protein
LKTGRAYYFEDCFGEFVKNLKLGIGGGAIYSNIGGSINEAKQVDDKNLVITSCSSRSTGFC